MSYLPGHFPAAAAAPSGGGVLTTLALHTSAQASGYYVDLTIPGTVIAGDLLVYLEHVDNGFAPPSDVWPSGFTKINTQAGGSNSRQTVSYKIATGSEASTTIFGFGGRQVEHVLLVFRGDVPIVGVTVGSVNGGVTNANPSAQNVTALGGTPPLIVIGAYGSSGAVNPRTFSPAKDGEQGANNVAFLAYKIYNLSPANVSVDMDDEGNRNVLQSFYFACS